MFIDFGVLAYKATVVSNALLEIQKLKQKIKDMNETKEIEIDLRGMWAVMHDDLFICAYASIDDIPENLKQFSIQQIKEKVPFENKCK